MYEERLEKIIGSKDPFWIDTISKFIEYTYDDKEQGINELEELAKDKVRFNEFTKQIIQRKEDFKSVRKEFLGVINNTSTQNNINNISEKIVKDIEMLDDNTLTSISALLNDNKYDSKTMFEIYDITITKLRKVGLYLDFDKYENQRVGLPFNIPFKKGYIKKIIISSRLYNGHYGKGSIFSDVVEFNLEGGNANIKSYIEFCIDERIKNRAKIEFSIPFSMNEVEIANLNEIVNTIQKNFQAYSKDETVKISISPEYFKFTDVSINQKNYSINSDSEILTKLRGVIKSNLSYEAMSKAYDELIDNTGETKKSNMTTAKCLCGNILNLTWNDEQKFQMIRCPKCNSEIKFKNPNLN